MEHVAEKIQQEYWRPAVQNGRTQEIPNDVRTRVEVCDNCGTEFVSDRASATSAVGNVRQCRIPIAGPKSSTSTTSGTLLDFPQARLSPSSLG